MDDEKSKINIENIIFIYCSDIELFKNLPSYTLVSMIKLFPEIMICFSPNFPFPIVP